MTEEEAKTKWCPFARAFYFETNGAEGVAAAAVNREPGNYDKDGNETIQLSGRYRCIASRCMAWRWEMVIELVEDSIQRLAPSTASGYCGLAGKE